MTVLNMLLYAVSYNLAAIIFFAAAWVFARKKKHFWQWYIIGLALQGYSTFGMILGMFREPETWRTAENFTAMAAFVLLALVMFFLLKRKDRQNKAEEN